MLPLSTRLVVVVLVSEPSGTRWFGPVSKRLPSRATEMGRESRKGWSNMGSDGRVQRRTMLVVRLLMIAPFPEARIARWFGGIILQSLWWVA